MQLTFPKGEHPSIAFGLGEISIGSGVDESICLSDHSLAPHHASLTADRRGLWLSVPMGTPGVHLNGRPVRQLAMLRVGDQICLEQVQVVICEDNANAIDQRILTTEAVALTDLQKVNASRIFLRGLSGNQFGRGVTLTETRVIGRSANCDIQIDGLALADRHAQFELQGEHVVLRVFGQNPSTFVNGVLISDAVLAPGDQITIDRHRFVLEAPGLPSRGQEVIGRGNGGMHTQTIQTLKASATEATIAMDTPVQTAFWWLIAAAAMLAAALTALLIYSPRIGG